MRSSSPNPLGLLLCRSVPHHRRPNDLFLINLRQKLFLEQHAPTALPTCICGTTVDPHSMHTFCCGRVSKMPIHHRTRDGFQTFLHRLLVTDGMITSSSKIETEPQGTVPSLPGCRPHDIAWRLVPPSQGYYTAPSPFTRFGIDITITPPKGHCPPSCANATPRTSAPAAKHLINKESLKLMRNGMKDNVSYKQLSGEEIIGELLNS